MLYLLDANVLIDADRDYYPIHRVPQFWAWILDNARKDRIRVCREVLSEITLPRIKSKKDDRLTDWAEEYSSILLLPETPDRARVSYVLDKGYAPDLSESEIQGLGADPYLIAYAAAARTERCIVTCEVSKPNKKGKNRRIPDVCTRLEVQVCDTFKLIRTLDFKA